MSWKANPITHWWVEAATMIWRSWRDKRGNAVIRELRSLPSDDKDMGIWSVFTQFLSNCGAIRSDIGIATINEARVLDLNMPLIHWRHCARALARNWWAIQAGVGFSEVQRIDWKRLDSMLGKPGKIRSSVAALISGTFLTAGFQNTTFADRGGGVPTADSGTRNYTDCCGAKPPWKLGDRPE